MKITKTQLKKIIKEELGRVLKEEDLAGLASSALEKVPDEQGTEYKVVKNILNQLANEPSEENMLRLINLAGTGRSFMLQKDDGKIVDVSLTARVLGYPLLNAAASQLGFDHAIFKTPKGRSTKNYIERLAT